MNALKRALLGFLVVAGAVSFPACGRTAGIELPFETVTKGTNLGWKERYWDHHPMLMIATREEELTRIGEHTLHSSQSPEGESLRSVDLGRYIALAIFLGYRSSPAAECGIEVMNVRQLGGQVKLIARIPRSEPGVPVVQEAISPYHVIAIDKSKMSETGDLELILLDASTGKELLRGTYTVP